MTLPPLTAIRAFEAVARNLSFTRAADELGMTQAAVSYQIKVLEARVGKSLFDRKPRQIALSATGRALFPDVRSAFDLLRESFARSVEEANSILSISAIPTFAARWLAANVGLFQLAHPNIAVRIDASASLMDLAGEPFDASIRVTRTIAKGLIGHELVPANVAPMMSPTLIEAYNVQVPADLLRVPRIGPGDELFGMWCKQFGIGVDVDTDRSFSGLGSQDLEASAALAGRGMAMLCPPFFSMYVAAGKLVQPFSETACDGYGYFLIYPEERRNLSKMRAFRDWIITATKPMREVSANS